MATYLHKAILNLSNNVAVYLYKAIPKQPYSNGHLPA